MAANTRAICKHLYRHQRSDHGSIVSVSDQYVRRASPLGGASSVGPIGTALEDRLEAGAESEPPGKG